MHYGIDYNDTAELSTLLLVHGGRYSERTKHSDF